MQRHNARIKPETAVGTIGDAARILNLSTSGVRHLEALGVLTVSRTGGGFRLYDLSEVRRVATERASIHAGEHVSA